MTKQFSIAVDAMGGDNAPEKVLEGINLLFENKLEVPHKRRVSCLFIFSAK